MKITERQQRRHRREEATIDHLARKVFKPLPIPAEEKPAAPGATTSTGLSVDEQIRKEWDPKKGGLPIF